MRIESVQVRPIDIKLNIPLTVAYGSYPVLEYALLILRGSTGILGLGEASPDPAVTGEDRGNVVRTLESLGEFLIGRDPFDVESAVEHCLEVFPEYPSASAAVDMALRDLAGKAAGLPVYRMIGGRIRDRVNLYPVIPLDSPSTMAALASDFAARGCKILKVKLGSDPETDVKRILAVREAARPGTRLRLDVNQGWKDASTALRAIKSVDCSDVDWIEQPVAASDIEGLAELRAAVDTPIMADESCHNPGDLLRIVRADAADMINIKLMKCGGICQALRMLAIAEAAGIRCILGSMGESSIGSSAGLHLALSRRNIEAAEVIGPLFIANDPASGFEADAQNLQASVSERPGLGVTLT